MREKKILREQMLLERAQLSEENRKHYANNICNHLEKLCKERSPNVVHSFIPFRKEPDLFPFLSFLLKQEITIVAPKTLPNRKLNHFIFTGKTCLSTGLFGTLYPFGTPVYEGNLDIILVPGLAFDKNGFRLGYGGGYYDNFLKEHNESYKIGIAFPFQLVEKIPVTNHDISVDMLLTGNANLFFTS